MSGSLPSTDAFAARYRALPTSARGAFVSDLRAARGWETAVEGAIVVAERDGTVRRIAVDQPDENTAVDAVVAADDRLRSLAETHDAEVLEPEALHDELLYGLDTRSGAELFREHFGDTDLEFPDSANRQSGARGDQTDDPPDPRAYGGEYPSLAPRNDPAAAGRSKAAFGGEQPEPESQSDDAGGDSDGIGREISLAVVLVAGVAFGLLLLASGSGAVGLSGLLPGEGADERTELDPASADKQAQLSDNSTTESTTDTTSEPGDGQRTWGITDNAQGVPLFRNGTHNAERIATTHEAAMGEHSAFRFRVRSEGPADAEGIEPPRNLDVRIAANNQFLVQEEYIRDSSGERVSVDVFADGAYEYWRFESQAGVRYNRVSIRTNPTVTDWSGEYGADLIQTYLNASESTAEWIPDDNRSAYRVTVDSPPPELDGEAVDYRANATIMADGTVRELTVTYRREPSKERVWVRLQYDIEDPDIGTPVWYDRARYSFDSGPRPGV